MTDGRDGLVRVDERPNERDGSLMHPEPVRVRNAAGKHQGVVISRSNLVQEPINREMPGRLVPLGRANLTATNRDQVQLGSRVREGCPWLGELSPLDPVGRQKRDLPAFHT